MTRSMWGTSLRKATTIPSILLVLTLGGLLQAQESPYGAPNQPYAQASQPYAQNSPQLSPGQLSDLVAPIALYPDPLLGQILVVSTYPQELMAAAQWLQYSGNLQGPQLMQAAQQQNWDPSVQALVAFPNVIATLTSNMQWTSALGQAFLAQPTDVMNAIQYLRAQAQSNGQLRSTPQLAVNTEYQNGQSAIGIEPVNPQMMYVPAYNPYSVWGPPADGGGYPALSYAGSIFGSLFSTAINLAGMFSGFTGLLGPSGWGWGLSWLAHALFLNNGFFSAFGFHSPFGGGGGGGGYGRSVWVHDDRRGGPAYAWNGQGRFDGGRGRFAGSGGGGWRFGAGRSGLNAQGWQGSGNYQRGNWETNAGNWRYYASNTRPPAYSSGERFGQPSAQRSQQWSWAANRGYQRDNRFGANGYAGAASFRPPSANWNSRPPGNGAYSNFANRAQAVPRDLRQARWSGGNGFTQPRMNPGHGFGSRPFSGSSRAPKQEHFKEPHFKEPHFKQPHFKEPHFKSHGSGHGHSGGKHRW